MSYTSERLTDDKPIVLFTYKDKLTADIFKNVIEDNARYIKELGEPIYIIADVRELETTFVDMLQIMQEAAAERDGNAHDDNIKMLIFVGSSAFAKMYRDTMQKRGAVFGIAMFTEMETAIEAAEIAHERDTREQSA